MELRVGSMDERIAKEIVLWKYERPYDFYNHELNTEEIQEKLNGSYNVLFDEKGNLFGFFCTGEAARVPIGHQYGAYNGNDVDMGLGMNPRHVGKGFGYEFCSFIINYILKHHKGVPIRLTVATFNQRAIHLYEKLGFVKKDKFVSGLTTFITMTLEHH